MASSTSSTSVSSSSTEVVIDDYVAYYPLQSNANDETGNHNGSASNVTFNDSYASFNGTTSYINVTGHTDLSNTNTVSVWAYLTAHDASGFSYLCSIQDAFSTQYSESYGNANSFIFVKSFTTASGIWSTPTSSSSLNSWYHIVFTYNDTNSVSVNPIGYINDSSLTISEHATPDGNSQNDTNDLNIGAFPVLSRFFTGYMRNLRLYDRVLTPDEVEAIYNDEIEFLNSSSSSSSSSSTEATFSTSSVSEENSSSSLTVELSSSSSSSNSTSSVNSTTSETSISESTTSNSTISESTTSETSLSTSSSLSNSSTSTSQSPSSVNSTTSASTTSESSQSSLDTTSISSLSTTSDTSTSITSSSSDETSLSTTSESSSNSSQSITDLYVSDVINRVRKLLNDPNSLRYSNTNLIYWLSDAVRTVRKIRYESRLDSDGNLTSFSEITSINDLLPIDDSWEECLVNYVCYRAFSEIKETMSSRERAPLYKELFYDSLGI